MMMKTIDFMSWENRGAELMIGKEAISAIVRRFGTPLYLYDSRIVLNRLSLIKKVFPDFDILYSVKSNPNPFILNLLASNGCYADVTSLGELKISLRNGFLPQAITYGGPAKSASDLEAAVLANIGTIDAESERELRTLEEIGTRHRKSISTTFRVNTLYRPPTAGEIMSGEPTKYGIDEEFVAKTLNSFSHKYVQINGVHTHLASQVMDTSALLEHYKRTAELSKDWANEQGFDLKIINFGGGIGVPYSAKETHLDISSLGEETGKFLSTLFPNSHNRPKFQLEIGRFLVAECGIFLTEVVEVKHSRGINFVITNNGISGFSRPVMPWAQQHPCTIVSRFGNPPTGVYKVVGPSCLASDVLCESAELPNPQPGDIIAMHNAGAYGFTMSMVLWANQSIPGEVVFLNDDYVLTKKPTTSSNIDVLNSDG